MMRATLYAVTLLLPAAMQAVPAQAVPPSAPAKTTHAIPDDVRRAVEGFFAPYIAPDDEPMADWDRPLYSTETTALIAQWRAHMGDEPIDALSNAGWLCLCQDWDQSLFRVEWIDFYQHDDDSVSIDLNIQPLGTGKNRLRMLLVKEDGRWLIEDMVSADRIQGLVSALRKQLRRPPGS